MNVLYTLYYCLHHVVSNCKIKCIFLYSVKDNVIPIHWIHVILSTGHRALNNTFPADAR